MSAIITLTQVSKGHHLGAPNEIWPVRDIDLAIERGQTTVLRGPSGSGKTTLLSLVGCMARPTSGRVHVEAHDVSALPERFLAHVRRTTIGFVFQQLQLVRGLSALENVMIPAYPLGPEPRALAARALALLDRLGVKSRAHEQVERLSGGEAQRVAIARALVNDPKVIIADEPTAALDTERSRQFLEIVADLQREGRTVLIATHDARVLESAVVQAVVTLRDGRIAEGDA